jgi:predicted GNAT family acetyltransferase
VAGGEAHLDYVVRGTPAAPVWDAVHTWVPPTARGQGAADRLTRAFLQAARTAGAGVAGSCSYVGRWLEAHPDA